MPDGPHTKPGEDPLGILGRKRKALQARFTRLARRELALRAPKDRGKDFADRLYHEACERRRARIAPANEHERVVDELVRTIAELGTVDFTLAAQKKAAGRAA